MVVVVVGVVVGVVVVGVTVAGESVVVVGALSSSVVVVAVVVPVPVAVAAAAPPPAWLAGVTTEVSVTSRGDICRGMMNRLFGKVHADVYAMKAKKRTARWICRSMTRCVGRPRGLRRGRKTSEPGVWCTVQREMSAESATRQSSSASE